MQTSLGEQCDAGKAKNGKEGVDCDVHCSFPPIAGCGDGKVNQAMELCDAGKKNADIGNAPCRSNCMLSTCGDGILDSNKEQCDDRNLLNGDGCSSTCRKEVAMPIPVIADTRPAAELLPAHIPTPARTPTGPGLVIFLASGAAAGWGATRKKRP
jgi:cysteine-rich repeat protein